jgi:hypothetical protein
LVTDLNRKEEVIEYIEAHPFCSRTNVIDNMPFADKTTKKVLKELIEEDKKITCVIDKKNPRVHQLIVNHNMEIGSEKINRLLKSTSAQLIDEDGDRVLTAYYLHNFKTTIFMNSTIFKTVKDLLANAENWEPYQSVKPNQCL